MNRFFMALLALLAASGAGAQYYYNDLIAAEQSDKQYQVLRTNRIQAVNARSYESDNKLAEGFQLAQEISKDFTKIITRTDDPSAGHSFTVSYYANNRISRTEDSSGRVYTVTSYSYDVQNHITAILSHTQDPARTSNSQELHQWIYDEKGRPQQMYKVKDGQDTTLVAFVYDEQGNIGEERWLKKGKTIETYYYYYNHHQLTDIVRFNARAKKLLPDYLLEYDEKGRMIQMTQVPTGSSNYLVWKYLFNAKGLKQRELCYNKQQQLVGRIEYSYQQQSL